MEVYFERVDDLEKNVDELLRKLSWKKIIRKDDRVLIKPNFCTHQLKNGVTTNPDLLRALVDIISKRASDVSIGETHSAGKTFNKLRENLGPDFNLIDLSADETCLHKGQHGNYRLPKTALESKIVNVPVLKTHTLTKVTLGMKNLFGFIQDKSKTKYHRRINEVVAELTRTLNPEINILDGIYSMDHKGPTEGRVRETGFLLASRSVTALDAATCRLIGLDPSSVEHIKLASSNKEDEIRILGEGYASMRLKLEIPELNRLEKFGVLLQGNPVTRRMLEIPGVYPLARKIKKML
jgi:uncharacterized protein (DUF362 family)